MAPTRAWIGGNLLLKLFLVGASTFGCLLWAIYLVEQRAHHTQHLKPTLTHAWKKLDSFAQAPVIANAVEDIADSVQQEPSEESVANDDAAVTHNVAIPSLYQGNIYMDWMGDSDDFDYINYKSLESLLSVYPKASIIVNLIAANGAHYYKMGNLISKHYFQKYLKYGYNVQMKIVYRHFRIRFDNDTLPPGAEYWNKGFDECCESARAVEINKYRYIPAHLYFYLRFFNLWSHGGVYSDFTWYHRRELPALQKLQVETPAPPPPVEVILDDHRRATEVADPAAGHYSGAIIKTMCPEQPGPIISTAQMKCQSSTLLAFSAGHPVLECMLMQYNASTTPFMTCLNQSTEVSGVLCVNQALSDCFASTSSRNIFLAYTVPGISDHGLPIGIVDPSCKEDSIFSCEGLKKAKAAHIKDIPSKDHAVPHWLASNRRHHMEEAHNSVHSVVNINALCELHDSQYHAVLYKHKDKFAHTYAHSPSNINSNTTKAAYTGATTVRRALRSERQPAGAASFALVYTQTYSQASATRELQAAYTAAVWLGAEAYSGDWAAPEDGSELAQLIAANPLKVPGPYYKDRFLQPSNGSSITTHSVQNEEQDGEPAERSSALRGAPVVQAIRQEHTGTISAAQYAAYPLRSLGRVSADEQEYLAKLRVGDITHLVAAYPQYTGCSKYKFDVTVPDKMVNQANVSCALHFVVPGFMKAGTTYMFGTLMTHPQLLNTLRGVTFKETGCYSGQFTQLKPWHGRRDPPKEVVKMDAKGVVVSDYRNRMHCFPFVESHEQMYYGDGTVWYAFHPEVRAALLKDNPELKVLFSVRNPVHRTESQHRFSYRTLERQYTADLNEIVPYLLDPATLPNSDGASLVDLRSLAQLAVNDLDPLTRQQKIDTLIRDFQKKPKGNKKYAALNQFVKYSIYFPAVYSWFQTVPARNIMVAPVEQLQVDRIADTDKLEYARNLTTAAQHSVLLGQHIEAVSGAERDLQALQQRHGEKQQAALGEQDEEKRTQTMAKLERDWEAGKAKVAKRRSAKLNDAFLAGQYNRLFRFLGLPEMQRIVEADSHPTGDKDIQPHHKLNQTTRCLLAEFYRPFNILLEDLLNEPLGYDEYAKNC